MSFNKVRYIDNWMSLAEALDLLYTASAYDKKGMNSYYKRLNEVQFYVNNLEMELQETQMMLRQFKIDYYKLLHKTTEEENKKIIEVKDGVVTITYKDGTKFTTKDDITLGLDYKNENDYPLVDHYI